MPCSNAVRRIIVLTAAVLLGGVVMSSCGSGFVAGVQIDPSLYQITEYVCAQREMDAVVDGVTVKRDVWLGRAEITNTTDQRSPFYLAVKRVEFENGEVKEGFGDVIEPIEPGATYEIETIIGLVDSTPVSCELQIHDSVLNY